MSGAEERAHDRSEPGTDAAPVYNGPSKAAINRWRINTPPIAKEEDEEE